MNSPSNTVEYELYNVDGNWPPAGGHITLLNTSICTTFGTYEYFEYSKEAAQALFHDWGYTFTSAIGHQSTAEILSELLAVDVPLNRIHYTQEKGQIALVFKLKNRPEEGKIFTKEEIEKIGYGFGILRRTA